MVNSGLLHRLTKAITALFSEKASNEGSKLDIPVAFNRVIVDFGQSIPSSHHYLVKFWVPEAADDALEKNKK